MADVFDDWMNRTQKDMYGYNPAAPASTATAANTTPNVFDQLKGLPTTDVLSTFAGSPAALWQSGRIAGMGSQAAIPQFQRSAMQGFTPAFGRYMLKGGTGSFADYMRTPRTAGFAAPRQDFTNAITASNMLNPAYARTATNPLTTQDRERMLTHQGYLTGDNARRNALAMAAAGMGGGVGYGAQARQRALGNLYDLYASRASGAGAPVGGFLGYLGGLMGQ